MAVCVLDKKNRIIVDCGFVPNALIPISGLQFEMTQYILTETIEIHSHMNYEYKDIDTITRSSMISISEQRRDSIKTFVSWLPIYIIGFAILSNIILTTFDFYHVS